jgi:ribonuclease Z
VIRVTFLGTAASRPTVGRNVSSIAIQHGSELLLFDCGEGTQRQMMRFASGFNVCDIFFTHLHGDHFLGVIGLLRTMALQGREERIRLWGPPGSTAILDAAVNLGIERVAFPVEIGELEPGRTLGREGYDIVAYRAHHGPNALGFALIEHERLGRFHPDRARELGVPEGPAFGRLHHGEAVEVNGRTIRPEDVVGPPRRGRRVVYSGDTRPSAETAAIAHAADLLIHDATFGDEESDRARATGHSTAREAARLAQRCGAAKLVLTHLSARYADDPRTLERQAREVFPGAVVAWDGLQIEVPLPEDDG